MSDKYEFVWKEGSFFEKGHWKLQKKDDGTGQFVAFIIIAAIVFFILCITAMSLALIAPLFVLWQMQRQVRYIGGIIGVLGFFYFIIDLQKQWISSILFFGWTSESGKFNEGILGSDSISIFWMVNFVGLGVSTWFIIEHLVKEKKLDFLVEAFSSGKQQISELYFKLNDRKSKPVKSIPITLKPESTNTVLPKTDIRAKNKTDKSFSKKLNIISISLAILLAISATIYISNEYSKYNQLSKAVFGKSYSELTDTEKVYIEILSEKNKE